MPIGELLRALFHGKGFAGQQCLVDEQIPRLEQPPVCGDEAPGGEQRHVARHDLRYRHFLGGTVAQHAGADLHRLAQPLRRPPGAVFLNEVEDDAHQHHDDDDEEARHLAGERGDDARRDQDQDQRIAETAKKLDQ